MSRASYSGFSRRPVPPRLAPLQIGLPVLPSSQNFSGRAAAGPIRDSKVMHHLTPAALPWNLRLAVSVQGRKGVLGARVDIGGTREESRMRYSRSRNGLLFLGLMLGTASLAFAVPPSPSAADGPAGKNSQHLQEFRDGNVTLRFGLEDVPSMPGDFSDVAARAAGLTDWNDREFADIYFDSDQNRVVLVPTTGVGAALASEFAAAYPTQVAVSPGKYSHAELKDGGRQLIADDPFLANHARELSVSLGSRGIDVLLDVAPEDEAQLVAAAEKYPFEVTFIVDQRVPVEGAPYDEDRRHDVDPYSGGLGYITANGATGTGLCSGAFGYRESGTDFMLTAGHCYFNNGSNDRMYMLTSGSTWASPQLGVWAGNWNGRSSTNTTDGSIQVNGSFHGDLALVNLTDRSHSAGNRMWEGGASTTNKDDVYNRIAPYLDLFICKGGASSGSSCGTLKVTGVNVDINLGNGVWLRNGDRAVAQNVNECSVSGDSGGSIYAYRTATTVTAVGVISGHTTFSDGTCQQRFTGAEEAVQAWGGDVRATG